MEMDVCFSLVHPARSELSVRHITGSWPISQTKFWQEPCRSTPRSKLTLPGWWQQPTIGTSSHEPFKDPLPGHTLPSAFLTASPPWYGNLRQLSPALEMPAKSSGLCTGCPEEPSVQSNNSQGVRNNHPTQDLGRIQTLSTSQMGRMAVVVSRGMRGPGKWGLSRPRDSLGLGSHGQLAGWGHGRGILCSV